MYNDLPYGFCVTITTLPAAVTTLTTSRQPDSRIHKPSRFAFSTLPSTLPLPPTLASPRTPSHHGDLRPSPTFFSFSPASAPSLSSYSPLLPSPPTSLDRSSTVSLLPGTRSISELEHNPIVGSVMVSVAYGHVEGGFEGQEEVALTTPQIDYSRPA